MDPVLYPGAVGPDRVRRIRSFDLELQLSEWGDPSAPVLVMCHGFYDHARAFDLFAPILAEHFRVVGIDSRGHGDSDWADAYPWFLDVLDVVNVLRSFDEPVVLLGHSRGGGQASDAAAMAPDRVRRLVNLDGFGPPIEGFSGPNRSGEDLSIPERFAMYLDWRRRGFTGFRPQSDVTSLAARRRIQNPRLSQEWLEYFTFHGARETEAGWIWKADPLASRGFGPFKPEWVGPSWRGIEAPVLALIPGEPDTWGPLPEPLLSERLANFRRHDRVVVDGAGHFMQIEKPAEVASIVLDWLFE